MTTELIKNRALSILRDRCGIDKALLNQNIMVPVDADLDAYCVINQSYISYGECLCKVVGQYSQVYHCTSPIPIPPPIEYTQAPDSGCDVFPD